MTHHTVGHLPRVERIVTAGAIRMRQVVYPEGHWMPAHAHQAGVAVYVLAGRITGTWRRRPFDAAPSSVFVMPSDDVHEHGFLGGVRTFDLVLEPEWLARVAPWLRPDQTRTWLNEMPNLVAARLYREFRQPDSVTPLMAEALTLELFASIARASSRRPQTVAPRWLWRVRDSLHASYLTRQSLRDVATMAGVHPSHIAREFKRHFHCSIGAYVRRLRIEYAAQVMTSTDAALATIATDAGFADQSHFSRAFKVQMGVTPAAYRRLHERV